MNDELGTCDTCGADYELASRDGRCGDCGECPLHCEHEKTCNCECGCEVPLDWGTCVDCGDGAHQNNNQLSKYCRHSFLYNNSTREYLICFDCGAKVEPEEDDDCEHAYSTDGENGICMFCGKDEIEIEEEK